MRTTAAGWLATTILLHALAGCAMPTPTPDGDPDATSGTGDVAGTGMDVGATEGSAEARGETGPPRPPRDGSAETETTGDALVPGVFSPPYRINLENIVRIVHARSPRVRAAREEMIAAAHGLDEFRTNLSRLEPFVETRADLADFPNRDGAFGTTMEAVIGIEKETFEGGLLALESGGAYSNFHFDDLNDREEGSGVLVRGRVEKPFFGSRRRQDRVIAQAFQESTARRAQLDYLDAYRDYVDNALSYYILYVYYDRLVEIYSRYVSDLQELVDDNRLREEDRGRVESTRNTAETTRNQYESNRKEYLTYLLAELGIGLDAEHTIDPPPPYRLSEYAVQAQDPEKMRELIRRARENNPTFTVLNDAIENAELQRRQALRGRYDVTTFFEGTLFPVGSETFDDRLDGWIVGGGVTVRLNDQHVLNATRFKAEAEIRQFRARLEAEETLMRRRIVTETQGLIDNDANHGKLVETIAQSAAVYRQRLEQYFRSEVNVNQLLEARANLASTESTLASNLYNTGNRERRLMGATGLIYDIVGLDLGDE